MLERTGRQGPLAAGSLDWAALLRGSRKRGAHALDYFLFSPGIFAEIPAFAIGRTVWDNWLVWKARSEGAMVVDATSVVKAIHQYHAYGHIGSPRRSGTGRRPPRTGASPAAAATCTHAMTRRTGSYWSGLVPNPLAVGHAGETVRRGWAKIGYRTGLRTA